MAVCTSALDLGDAEKKDAILFPREVEGRRLMSIFSLRGDNGGGLAVGMLAEAKGFPMTGLRGIAV